MATLEIIRRDAFSVSDLVSQREGRAVTTSMVVAQVFGMRNADVNRAIRDLISARAKLRWLYESSTYIDKQGKPRPMYYISKDGFVLLAMGFTGRKALDFKIAYINAFNEMERRLREAGSGKELALAARMLDKCIGWLNSSLKSATGKAGAALVPYGDVRLGIIPTNGDFETKLANMFAQLHNCYLDALSLSGKRLEAEKALERLNRETWLTLNKIK